MGNGRVAEKLLINIRNEKATMRAAVNAAMAALGAGGVAAGRGAAAGLGADLPTEVRWKY